MGELIIIGSAAVSAGGIFLLLGAVGINIVNGILEGLSDIKFK